MNRKYAPLEAHLRASGVPRLGMTFLEIEQVIGARLPPSAYRHRALWSNNPSNWVMTQAWLDAGYKTVDVDLEKRRLVFRKAESDAPGPNGGGASSPTERSGSFADSLGALKGSVTIAPGTDLTAPIDVEWDAAR